MESYILKFRNKFKYLLPPLSSLSLSDLSQFGDLTGTYILSIIRLLNFGVPQGAILGPLLFFIYVNDMSSSLDCPFNLYGDDSALLNCC